MDRTAIATLRHRVHRNTQSGIKAILFVGQYCCASLSHAKLYNLLIMIGKVSSDLKTFVKH